MWHDQLFVDMDWLFEEDFLRDPGIIRHKSTVDIPKGNSHRRCKERIVQTMRNPTRLLRHVTHCLVDTP